MSERDRRIWIPVDGDLPWWARLFIFLAFNFLFPVALVAILFAMGTGWIASPVTETHAMVKTMHASSAVQVRLLREICRHTAKTEIEHRSCEEDGR